MAGCSICLGQQASQTQQVLDLQQASQMQQASRSSQTAQIVETGDSKTSTTAVSSDYVLGKGDQITLHVGDMEEISDKPLRIDPDGGIDLPLIGRMQASGLTMAQFKTALAAKLSKYINDPQISVNLTDNQSRPVSIIGEVNTPGVHQLAGPRNLIEVISLAGGLKPTAGSKVIVTRETRRGPLNLPNATKDTSGNFMTASLSLDDLLASKSPAQNIMIQPNDVISIPKGEIVYIVGDVRRAGGFPLASHETMSIIQAVSLAEGFGPNAATGNAKILRPVPGHDGQPQEIPVNLKHIFSGKSPDVSLYANDILFIPNSAAKTGARRAIDSVLQVAMGVAIYARP